MADANMFLAAMKETMVIICCRDRYKNGAFSHAITHETHLLNDLKALITSPLLADDEKHVFRKAKEDVVYMRNTQAHGQKPDMLRFIMAGNTAQAIEDVVHTDMRARGLYVPPLMFQAIGEDGQVTRSTLIGDDGEETHFQGGMPGQVPGAPKAFNDAQAEAYNDAFDHKGGADVGIGMFVGATVSRKGDPSASEKDTGEFKAKEVKTSAGDPGFGAVFEANLKHAFL